MKNFILWLDYEPELGQDDYWFFVFLSCFVPLGEGWQDKLLRLAVFALMQSVQCVKEKVKMIIFEKCHDLCSINLASQIAEKDIAFLFFF